MASLRGTPAQMEAIMITERVSSSLSIIGNSFVFLTFAFFPSFHKPINRLIVYASLGNICSNVATMISTSALDAGVDSALCQTQAFLIQMFFPADVLWAFAMACNVYLTFFRKYDQRQLRALEWRYLLFCYGGPFISSFVFCFASTRARGKIYGSAVIWCWIAEKWGALRLITHYGPIWLAMLATSTIYIVTGIEILRKRRQLQSFLGPDAKSGTSISQHVEVEVTSEAVRSPNAAKLAPSSTSDDRQVLSPRSAEPYSILIESHREGVLSPSRGPNFPQHLSGVDYNANRAFWAYTRCAFFFFLAMIITWVPSSINRGYGVAHPTRFNFGLQWVASFVLPLQGFWNAVIYIVTSLPACAGLWAEIKRSVRPNHRLRSSAYGTLNARSELGAAA